MPLHPLIVHFPVALLLLGTLVEIASLKFRKELNNAGTLLLIAGVISGIAAYMTGDGGERFAEMHFGEVEGMIHQHESMALTSMLLFGAAAAIKLFTHFKDTFRQQLLIVVIILSIIGSGFLAYTGHLGGQIVYQNEQITQHQLSK